MGHEINCHAQYLLKYNPQISKKRKDGSYKYSNGKCYKIFRLRVNPQYITCKISLYHVIHCVYAT